MPAETGAPGDRPPAGALDRADVVVVGAGIAGAAAMLEAHGAGVSVIGIDQLPQFGGTTIASGGGCSIPGSRLQEAQGVHDSPDLALRDLVAAGEGEADEVWARFYMDHAVRDVYEWLVDRGVEFVQLRRNDEDSVPRWHGPRGSGRALMDRVWEAMDAAGLAGAWRFSMTVEDLLHDDDGVVGVVARDVAGRRREVRARSVVMATGGFAGSLDMVLRHRPDLRRVERLLIGGGVGARGTGHDILERHGAVLSRPGDLDCYANATPDYRDPAGQRGLVLRGLEGGIRVNRDGLRFHDESRAGPGTATPALLAQVPPTCWVILGRSVTPAIRIADPHFRSEGGVSPERIDELVAQSEYVHRSDDLADLARSAGIAPDGLRRTVAEWNGALAAGLEADPATGRPLAGVPALDDPPYLAIQLFPLVRKNLGGVRTDLRCRVLDAASDPIAGLYAAGELTGFGGGHLSGRTPLEGIMIGGSLFSGRVAGGWAAHAAGGRMPVHLDAAVPRNERRDALRRRPSMH